MSEIAGGHRVLAGPVTLSGVGLFSSTPATIRLRAPSVAEREALQRAGASYGVIMVGGEGAGRGELAPLLTQRVMHKARHTVVALQEPVAGGMGRADRGVATTEHVISALAGCGVTHCVLELDAAEVPLLDGSAIEFARAITQVGLVAVADGSGLPLLLHSKAVTVVDGAAEVTYRPLQSGEEPGALHLQFELDYGPDAPIEPQVATFVHRHDGTSSSAYMAEIAPARTFCTLAEAEAMRASGMFGHLRASDVLVIGPSGPVDTSYRLVREPARHKVLDMLGDISLCGRAIVGHISGKRSGHHLNHQLVRALMAAAGEAAGE